jgi:G:T-mismatch repair DNA endonuclease (very short patch repair protein)
MAKDNLLICDYCKKEYFVSNFEYNLVVTGKKETHSCSKECANKMLHIKAEKKKENWPKLTCDWCGKEFQVKPFEYRQKQENKLFIACGRDCAQKLMGKFHKGENSSRYKEKIKKNCLYCGKEYEINPYEHEQNISNYCSKECVGLAKTKNATIILNCQYCGKEFPVLKGQLNFWGELKYCSEECRKSARIKKPELTCVMCGKKYHVSNNRKDISICCSRKCLHEWLSKVYSEIPEVKERLRKQGAKSAMNQKTEYTLPERIVLEYLVANNIVFIPQCLINDRLVIDFYLPDYNCTLEVYGDYWHSNPRKHGKDKIPLSAMQEKNKQKDIRKYKVLTGKLGYYFYSLWEYDIKHDLDDCMNKFFKYIDFKIRNEQVVLQ